MRNESTVFHSLIGFPEHWRTQMMFFVDRCGYVKCWDRGRQDRWSGGCQVDAPAL